MVRGCPSISQTWTTQLDIWSWRYPYSVTLEAQVEKLLQNSFIQGLQAIITAYYNLRWAKTPIAHVCVRLFSYLVRAFVERNSTHEATIVVATIMKTAWVFQPAWTKAARRL